MELTEAEDLALGTFDVLAGETEHLDPNDAIERVFRYNLIGISIGDVRTLAGLYKRLKAKEG